jgi:NO-binding membrane sensor protein with MHYT domain/signal transduction histidine kinase
MLSFAVALFASYTALDMGTRLRRATGHARRLWLGGSAVVLGGGIWSMHFIAMLAFNAGVPVSYDPGLTALSLVIAIAIVALGFHLVTRANSSLPRLVLSGCIVGVGVAAMHYTGMSAVILSGVIQYDPLLVGASVLVAIVAATAALWLTLNLTNSWQRVAAAVVMAVAVCGMHYTAMLATRISIVPCKAAADPYSGMILAAAIAVGVFLILCLALVCVFVDRRFELLAEREAESLRASNLLLRSEIEERQAIARELLTTNAALSGTQSAIRNLLDNADQGFLTVAADLLVGDQSSAACETILGERPTGKSIVALLCAYMPGGEQATMKGTLESVFRDCDPFVRDLKLGLLPTEFALDGRSLRVNYKYLADSTRLMLILTDVTQTVRLAETVERERLRLEMIVLALTEGDSFAALVNDYRKFLTAELPALLDRIEDLSAPSELYGRVHTYKGLLAQFSFHTSPRNLHEFETRLASKDQWTVQSVHDILGSNTLLADLNHDLECVADALGSDFESSGRHVALSQRQLQSMETVAQDVLAKEEGRVASPPLRGLLQTLANLSKLDVKAALLLHSRAAIALAGRLEKQLAPVQIQGDDAAVSPACYTDFFRSLVHVFRNVVDHGIELPEERQLLGKPADGLIVCDVRDRGGWLEILIADDGRGVDRGALENKLAESGIERSIILALSLEDLVFREGLSSRDTASEISGRGVGLAVVKAEVDRLGGSITLETKNAVGTAFCFRLPLSSNISVLNPTVLEMAS